MLIRVKNLKLKTIIGVYEWEKHVNRDLVFNIEVEIKTIKSISSDNLSDTVDYDEIVEIVKKNCTKRFFLIEKMAGEILKEIMKNKKVLRCKIEIDKIGIISEADSCSVVIEKKKNRWI
jgi:dihydroneopterin aldolase